MTAQIVKLRPDVPEEIVFQEGQKVKYTEHDWYEGDVTFTAEVVKDKGDYVRVRVVGSHFNVLKCRLEACRD